MGNIELWLGDCLEKMKDIPDGSVDLVLTDPPYGTTKCKWDSVIPFEPMWEQLKRIIKPNGAIVLFGSQPFTSALVMSNPKMFKYEWVWDKVNRYTGYGACKTSPLKRHENLLVFGGANYFPQMTTGKPYKKTGDYSSKIYGTGKIRKTGENTGTRYPYSILSFKGDDKKNGFLHPTQKPVALLEYLIKTYTNEGETVLDFTMGSGTTGVACKNLNRNFIGIELDPEYFKIAEKRINENLQNHNFFGGSMTKFKCPTCNVPYHQHDGLIRVCHDLQQEKIKSERLCKALEDIQNLIKFTDGFNCKNDAIYQMAEDALKEYKEG